MVRLASWLFRPEAVAFTERMATQEIGGGHTLLAGGLEFHYPDDVISAGSVHAENAAFFSEIYGPCMARWKTAIPTHVLDFDFIDDESARGLPLAMKKSVRR